MTESQVTQPAPTSETWAIDLVLLDNGSKAVRLQIFHLGGVHVSFLPPDAAIGLGTQLAERGNEGRSGLLVPSGYGLAITPDG